MKLDIIDSKQLRDQLYRQLYSQLCDQLDNQLDTQLSDQLYRQLRNQLYSQLDTQLYSQLRAQLRDQLRAQLSDQLYRQLRNQLYSQLDTQLYSQLRAQLRDQLKNKNLDYYYTDYWGETSDYGYLCFYDFIYNEIFPNIKIPVFEEYLKLADANIVSLITFNNIAFISRPPKFISFNNKNQLHCTNDYAVYFNDKWGLHYVNGTYFEIELFNKAFKNKTITPEEILQIENAEQKAVIIQEYGFEYIFNNLKQKEVIDKQIRPFNKKPNMEVEYTLFKTSVIDNIQSHVLKVEWYEKGKKRQTVLGVPNTITDAIKAVAWTCYMTKDQWEKELVMEA